MDLSTGRVITRPKVTQCKMTDVVIKAVEAIGEKQDFVLLKNFNRKREETLFLDTDMLIGVDGEDDSDSDDEDYTPEVDDDTDDESVHHLVYRSRDSDSYDDSDDDEDRVREVLSDMKNVDHAASERVTEQEAEIEGQEETGVQVETVEEEIDEEEEEPERGNSRLSRSKNPPERLDPTFTGKSYAQVVKESMKKWIKKPPDKTRSDVKLESPKKEKKVRFADEKVPIQKEEICHNLFDQSFDPKNNVYYNKKKVCILQEQCTILGARLQMKSSILDSVIR